MPPLHPAHTTSQSSSVSGTDCFPPMSNMTSLCLLTADVENAQLFCFSFLSFPKSEEFLLDSVVFLILYWLFDPEWGKKKQTKHNKTMAHSDKRSHECVSLCSDSDDVAQTEEGSQLQRLSTSGWTCFAFSTKVIYNCILNHLISVWVPIIKKKSFSRTTFLSAESYNARHLDLKPICGRGWCQSSVCLLCCSPGSWHVWLSRYCSKLWLKLTIVSFHKGLSSVTTA